MSIMMSDVPSLEKNHFFPLKKTQTAPYEVYLELCLCRLSKLLCHSGFKIIG